MGIAALARDVEELLCACDGKNPLRRRRSHLDRTILSFVRQRRYVVRAGSCRLRVEMTRSILVKGDGVLSRLQLRVFEVKGHRRGRLCLRSHARYHRNPGKDDEIHTSHLSWPHSHYSRGTTLCAASVCAVWMWQIAIASASAASAGSGSRSSSSSRATINCTCSFLASP